MGTMIIRKQTDECEGSFHHRLDEIVDAVRQLFPEHEIDITMMSDEPDGYDTDYALIEHIS
jgi:hypothetical protein